MIIDEKMNIYIVKNTQFHLKDIPLIIFRQ